MPYHQGLLYPNSGGGLLGYAPIPRVRRPNKGFLDAYGGDLNQIGKALSEIILRPMESAGKQIAGDAPVDPDRITDAALASMGLGYGMTGLVGGVPRGSLAMGGARPKPVAPTQGMVNMRIANMAKGNEERVFAQQHGIPESVANRLFEKHAETGILGPGSGGRTPLPSGTSVAPQPLLPYPRTGPPQLSKKVNPKGERWPEKQLAPEELHVKKALGAANRDIKAGKYEPYFDVSKRTDVDPSKYPAATRTTLEEAVPKLTRSGEKVKGREYYEGYVKDPEIRARLQEAFKEGRGIKNSENWYFMGQLEAEFTKELGPVAGRLAFMEKFAKPMAATTAGADPVGNLRMAMYGNYLKANNLPIPPAAHQMPHPVGGRRAMPNIRAHEGLVSGQYFDPVKNPKRFNFARNYIGDRGVVTVDEQMTGLIHPGLAKPPGPSYGIFEGIIGEEAKRAGVAPRAFQDVAWAGTKKLKTEAKGKVYPGSKPMIQIVNESIERTSRMTGLTPKEVVKWGIIHSRIPMYGLVGAVGLGAVSGVE